MKHHRCRNQKINRKLLPVPKVQDTLELTRNHLYNTTLGRHSPFHKIAEMGGYVMLLGCDHNPNSTIHVAESLAEIPFIYVPTLKRPSGMVRLRQLDGRVKNIQFTEFSGCSDVFSRVEKPLRRAGIIRDGKIGNAQVQLMKGMDIFEVMIPILKKDPGMLLCDKQTCVSCPARREVLKKFKEKTGYKSEKNNRMGLHSCKMCDSKLRITGNRRIDRWHRYC